MTGLTHQMDAAVAFIRDYKLEHGASPSFAQIAQGVGLKSKSGVVRIVAALEARGKIRRLAGRARSLELVPASPVLSVELPPHLYHAVQAIARTSKVTPEAVVIEAVSDGFAALRSKTVPHETSGGDAPPVPVRGDTQSAAGGDARELRSG